MKCFRREWSLFVLKYIMIDKLLVDLVCLIDEWLIDNLLFVMFVFYILCVLYYLNDNLNEV